MKAMVLVVSVVFLAGCGGAIAPSDDGGTDAGVDAPPDANGWWPCGDTSCAIGNVCVHPCCGGVEPVCDPANDAGVCPPGDMKGGGCAPLHPGDDCAPPACQPPPPFCAPDGTNQCQELDPNNGDRDCYEACA